MFDKFKSYLETISVTPASWLIGITGILVVRFFLEALSNPSSTGIIASDASTLVHYSVYFFSFALAFMIFLYFALPNWRNVLPQLTVTAFVSILLAPIIDFAVSGGAGTRISYLFAEPGQMFITLTTFFGPLNNGISIGIRIEVAIILAAAFFLIHKVQKNLLRSIISE